MSLIQRDDLIEQLAPAAADPALRDSILPRALDGGLHARHVHGTNGSGNLQPVFRVSVEDQKSERRLEWKCFPQLLDDPTGRRMLRDVEVQDPPATMADHKKTIDYAEGDRRVVRGARDSPGGGSDAPARGEPAFRGTGR